MIMTQILRRGWVGVALETTAGVPVNPADYVPFVESSLKEKHEPLPDNAAYGIRDSESENSVVGRKWGEGSLKVNLDPTLAGYFLGLGMGDFGTPVNEGSGVYTHTMARVAGNAPKTATVIFDRVTDRMLFPYCVVNSFEAAFADGLASLSAGIMSRFPQTSVSGTLATASGNLFSRVDATLRLDTTVTAAESATALKVISANVKVDNAAERIHVAGNADTDGIYFKDHTVSGEIRLLFENTTQRDYYRALTKRAAVLTFTGRGIGGGFSEFVKFRIYKMRTNDWSIDGGVGDLTAEVLSFVGEYSSGDSKTLDVQVRNRKASY